MSSGEIWIFSRAACMSMFTGPPRETAMNFRFGSRSSIARETGARVVVLMPSVGGEKEITDYFKLFDDDIAKLKQAFDETK